MSATAGPDAAGTAANTSGPLAGVSALRPLLASMLLLGGANSVLFAVSPPVGRLLGFKEWQIGFVVAFSAAAYMVFAAVWGRVSDLRGRRYVLVIGMLGFGLGGLAFAAVLDLGLAGVVTPSLALVLLIATRMVQSLVSAGAYPAAQAHIAENSPPERRAVALSAVTSAFALGSVLGPALAGLLVMLWITLPLYAVAALALGAGAWVAREMGRSQAGSGGHGRGLSPFDRRVASWIVFSAIYFVSVAGTQQVLGFVLQDRLGLGATATATMTSSVFMATGVVAVLFQLSIVRGSRWSARALMTLGLAAAATAQAGLLVADQPWHFLAVALPLGVSFTCVSPGFAAAASISVGAHEQGAAAGLVAAAQAAGFLVGPVLFAVVYRSDPETPFAIALAIALMLLLIVVRIRVSSS